MNSLFEPTKLGHLSLSNKIVMAPMTRSRASSEHVPTDMMAKYYGARATAGLIITEGTSPSANGLGYARIPGLFNQQHVEAWKKTTTAVHAGGGKIFIQLMHCGRVSHPLNMPPGTQILSASAVQLTGETWTDQGGMKPYGTPEAMTEAQIQTAIKEYAQSATLAIQAGFDGIELHGANGYLIDQFLNTASNKRTDQWGGSVQNRLRFAVEVAKACVAAIGGERVGIRVSPYGVFNGMQPDDQMDELYSQLMTELTKLNLVYVHVVDHSAMGAPPVKPEIKGRIRDLFKGKYILSGGYDAERAGTDLATHKGDLVAFGRPFMSNANLVEKLRTGHALTPVDMNTAYTPGEKGYTDYPA